MNALAQAERLWTNLLALGARRLAVLGLIGFAVFAVTGLSGYYLSRPSNETLYSGLDRDDVVTMGAALRDAGVPFDVSADGGTILVPVGQAAFARMTLAEKGLPHSGSVGNELFDKLGSLGLTSFMQEVTRVRAMEGELARTIQMMHGVKAARVHIVMQDEGSFRRERQPPSASVVIRTEVADDASTAQAIRHLVAAAVPGMKTDEVTVLNVDGLLLASGSDSMDQAPSNMLSLQKNVSQEIQDSVRKTLAPYLSLKNFQISVAARLNTDKKQTNETIYNPDQRVERSVRVIKESQSSQNSTGQNPTSVERNLPQQQNKSANGDSKQSNDENQKREELTNYEISSKATTTTSSGYAIDNLSVAVLVNRAAFGDKATPEAIDKQVKDIEQLVSSAAGLRKDRGDVIKVSVVDFVDSGRELEPVPGPSIVELLLRQSGSLISAAAVITVALMLIWFGLRPATRMLLAAPAPSATAGSGFGGGEAFGLLPDGGGFNPALAGDGASAALPGMGMPGDGFLLESPSDPSGGIVGELMARKAKSPQRQLEQLIEHDEEQAAAILKQWIRQGSSG
jgi:flagellar M-ring protein FliF